MNPFTRAFIHPLLTLPAILGGCAALPGGAQGSADLLELRIYHCPSAEGQEATLEFVREVLQPALNRQGVAPIGVFTPTEAGNLDVYLLCAYSTPEELLQRNGRLSGDSDFLAAAEEFAAPGEDPPYTRIESRLMRAFDGMPQVTPPRSESSERLLELRIYESPNEELARRKVEMFNSGEIELMQEVGLGPVFFGETLGAADMPNLVYMLSADSEQAHSDHWQHFLRHPEWARMRDLPRYADTVSKITSTLLRPADCSDI